MEDCTFYTARKGGFCEHYSAQVGASCGACGMRSPVDARRGRAEPSSIEVRPVLAAFAMAMEAKLQQRDKKYGYWGDDAGETLRHFNAEVSELLRSIAENGFRLRENADLAGEAVDVANLAMMLWEINTSV